MITIKVYAYTMYMYIIQLYCFLYVDVCIDVCDDDHDLGLCVGTATK